MFNALRLSSSIATPAAAAQPERSNASFRCGRPLVCGDGKLSCNAIAVACLAAIRRECEDEGESMPSMQWGKGASAQQCQNGIGLQ